MLKDTLFSIRPLRSIKENVTSFRTAKLHGLIGLHIIFGSSKAVFSICLRYEYDFRAIIILLIGLDLLLPLLPKCKVIGLYTIELKNSSTIHRFCLHFSKLVLTRIAISTNNPFDILNKGLKMEVFAKNHKNEPQKDNKRC